MRAILIIFVACITLATFFIFANNSAQKVEANQKTNSKDSVPVPGKIPASLSFNSYSIVKPSNDGISVKKVVRASVSVSIYDIKRQMDFDMKLTTGKIRFYWSEVVEQKLNNYGAIVKGTKFIGVDDSGKYAEVELFYNRKSDVEMIVIRADNNTSAVTLMDIADPNTKIDSEISSEADKQILLGEWFVLHQAFINFKFKEDGTFTMTDANNSEITGKYIIKYLKLNLYILGKQSIVILIYKHPKDDIYRFMYKNLEFISGKQLSE